MIVTEKAAEQLAAMLDQAGASGRVAVRISRGEEGWRMRLDRESPDDETFDHRGRTVLVLGQSVAEALADATLDVRETDEGPSLVISEA